MSAPTRSPTRRFWAAGVAAAIVMGGLGFLAGSYFASLPDMPATEAPPLPTPAEVVQNVPLPTVEATLGRQELLAAAASAATAYAEGRPLPPEVAQLAGRRFEIRIPFGCFGPAPEDAGAHLRWNYNAADAALRISALPESWSKAPWIRAIAGEEAETVEGFWVPKPWLESEGCPRTDGDWQPAIWPAPRETVGIAQFFGSDSPRAQQRKGRPYSATIRVKPEEFDASQGYRLLLRGRVTAAPNGRPVVCHSESADYRPSCLIAADLELVAFENPQTGELLAQWRS